MLQMAVMLVNRRRIKAKELAEFFGVSVRTIYRDAETISLAGIPIVAYPGLHGGLGIAEGYRMDRTVLSEEELAGMMLALQTVSGSLRDTRTEAAQEKLKALVTGVQAERFRDQMDSVRIDFGPWAHASALKAGVELLKAAIAAREIVGFTYCNARGETVFRNAEPYTLVLKNNHWYLYAFCLLKEEFRLFKVNRMRELAGTGQYFVKRELQLDEPPPWEQEWMSPARTVSLVLRFSREVRVLVEDWFGVDQVLEEMPEAKETLEGESGFQERRQRDAGLEAADKESGSPASAPGWLYVQVTLPEDDWLYSYLLSFGSRLEIVRPERVRQRVRSMAEEVAALYSHGEGKPSN